MKNYHSFIAIMVWILLSTGAHAATMMVNSSVGDGEGEDASADSTHCTFPEAFNAIQNGRNENGCSNQVADEAFGTNDSIYFSVESATLNVLLAPSNPKPVVIARSENDLMPVDSSNLSFRNPVTLNVTSAGRISLISDNIPSSPFVMRNILMTGSTTRENVFYFKKWNVEVGGCQFTRLNKQALVIEEGSQVNIIATSFNNNDVQPLSLSGNVSVVLDRDSFFDNRSTSAGGAVNIHNGNTTILNSTFSRNTGSQGGAIVSAGDGLLMLLHNTIYGNNATIDGGGIKIQTSYNFYGNIIAGNNSPSTPEKDCSIGDAVSGFSSYNIFSASTSTTGCHVAHGVEGNQVIADFSLGENIYPAQGAYTSVWSLVSGNSALNAIPLTHAQCSSRSITTYDQRRVSRPSGAGCDIGAYELFTPSVVEFTSSTASVREGDTLTLNVRRTGSTDGYFSVDYSSVGALTLSDDLRWANQDGANKSIVIPILADSENQGNRTFTISLLSDQVRPSIMASVGTTSSVTVTIQDVPVVGSGGSGGSGTGGSGSGGVGTGGSGTGGTGGGGPAGEIGGSGGALTGTGGGGPNPGAGPGADNGGCTLIQK